MLNKCTLSTIDLICLGSSWENEPSNTEFDIHPRLKFDNVNIPKTLYLNKEYKKLDKKFEYISKNKIDIVFTVHHNYLTWQKELGVRFVQLPFAIDQKLFRDYGEKKKYDLG